MSIISPFPYMPPGSYAMLIDGSIFWRKEVSPELKERFLRDLEKERKETRERNSKGIYSDKDIY